jgi:ABC-type transport system involved in multi-copper enzyme maturation permease subunit
VRIIIALALAGFREALRNRVTVVVGVFAAVMLLLTAVMLNVTLFSLDRMVTDFGLSVMSLLLSGLAIFLSSGLISKEIERRTIFLVVSRPVSRTQFVLGRFLGNVLTLTVLQAVMAALFLLQLQLFEVPKTQAQLAAVLGLSLELVLLTAVGLLCSVLSSQLIAAITCVGLYLLGHLADDLYALATRSQSVLTQQLGKVGYYLLPNLSRVNYRGAAAYELPIDWSAFGGSTLYIAGYTAALLMATTFAFDRRDFK